MTCRQSLWLEKVYSISQTTAFLMMKLDPINGDKKIIFTMMLIFNLQNHIKDTQKKSNQIVEQSLLK
jgi:hypothetical protein